MSYEEIIREIKSGITGEVEADIKYLEKKIAEYESHEDREAIAGACGQMIYELLPEDLKEEFSSLNNGVRLGLDEVTADAARMIEGGDHEGAGKRLKEGIELLEGSDIYRQDTDAPFYDFRKPMEEAIFRERYGFEKRIRLVPEPVVGLYRMYAGLLYDKGEHEEALLLLEKAMRWNPYHQKTPLEYADNLRELERLDDFKKVLVDIFTAAYEPETLAACYRRLGWYYGERGEWNPAAACVVLAGIYGDNNEYLEQEKKYILSNAGEDFVLPSEEDLERIATEYGFPFGPDEFLVEIARNGARAFGEAGNEEASRYFRNIADDLVKTDI